MKKVDDIKKKEIIFIGNNFYRKSGTMMSSVYEKVDEGYKRTDWGFIQISLEKGYNLSIRPATKDEMKMFNEQLKKFNKKV